MIQRYCLACDLKDQQTLISQYRQYHEQGRIWPEIIQSIKEAGIRNMEIYLTGNRLFMIIEADDTFSFENKAKMDAVNDNVQQWETLMDQFQQRLPWAQAGEKWVPMQQIFKLPG